MTEENKLTTILDFEKAAKEKLSKAVFGYYYGGADKEITMNRNTSCFSKVLIIPKMLVDVSHRDMSMFLMNGRIKLSSPICIAPTAGHCMAHPDGEAATARAAAAKNTLIIVSTVATTSLEDIAVANGPEGLRWFQLYVFKDREVTKNLIRRAEKAGYQAIVLTVDVPVAGERRRDVVNKFEMPREMKLANFEGSEADSMKSDESGGSGFAAYVNSLFDPSLSWEDVRWLKSFTKLPVIIKGILHPKDAKLAVDQGVDGIIVSNHGGRQLDTVPAAIEVLPAILRAVDGKCDVFVDGGIHSGGDVFKAVGLGAKAVFVGRPILWGLAAKGEDGVKDILSLLNHQLDTTMMLAGCPVLTEMDEDLVVREETVAEIVAEEKESAKRTSG